MHINPSHQGCCLFVFAHPDDEFGCFESIFKCVDGGGRAICVYLTDGGYAGQSVARREAESIAVLTRLRVMRSDIEFIGMKAGIKDGALHESLARATSELEGVLRRSDVVECVYVPAWEGGHSDHDAAHAVALTVCEKLGLAGRVWQYSLYNGKDIRRPFFKVMSPLAENGPCVVQRMPVVRRLRYLRYCLSYPSQWKTWIGLFPFVLVKILFAGCYEVQRADMARLSNRPHAGELLYERRGDIRYDGLRLLIEALRNRHGSGSC